MSRDSISDKQDRKQPTVETYIAGFGLSLILTLSAFLFVWLDKESGYHFFTTNQLLIWISVLAITQLIVQLIFFLHLSRESGPRWNLNVLSFAAIVVGILVFGSLWIMNNLSRYHGHQPDPQVVEEEILKDEGIHHH